MDVYVSVDNLSCSNSAANFQSWTYPATTTAITSSCTHIIAQSYVPADVTSCAAISSDSSCRDDSKCQYLNKICFQSLTWLQVKYLPKDSSSWFSQTDGLAGSQEIGSEGTNAEWAIKFFHLTFDKFMFSNDDFKSWTIATKT